MENFVAYADFAIQPYDIANLSKKQNNFAAFVTKEQAVILRRLLGAALYSDFEAGLAAPAIDAKWLALRDGADYVWSNGVTYHWDGMKDMLIPYMYHLWTTLSVSNNSGQGVNAVVVENSEAASPRTVIVRAFNAFRDKAGKYICYPYKDVYINSLFGYLFADANIALYPNAAFTPVADLQVNFFDF